MESLRRLVPPLTAVALLLLSARSYGGENIWTSNGPDATPLTVRSLTIDSRNPSVLYAGTTRGEVFRTTDGAETWELLASDLPALVLHESLAIRITINPEDSETIYAATIGGVAKSEDGGLSWFDSSVGLPAQGFVTEVVVDPSSPSTLYAPAMGGVFKSSDAGLRWASASAGLIGSGAIGLTVHPTQADTVFAAVTDRTARLYFKTTDGAASWAHLENGLPRSSAPVTANLIVSPADPSVLYASLSSGIYRSTDDGASWTLARSFITSGRLAADPVTPETLYVGLPSGVVKLLEGGDQVVNLGNGLGQGPVIYDIVVDPQIPTRVYAATRLGVFRIDQTPDVCGNFTVEPGEECDAGDGNGVEGGCCTDSCQIDRTICGPCQSCFRSGCGGALCTPTVMTATPSPMEVPSTATPMPCPGDCDGDQAVTVDELVTVVNIALGARATVDCAAGDVDGNRQITVDEVVAAVQSALSGCPANRNRTGNALLPRSRSACVSVRVMAAFATASYPVLQDVPDRCGDLPSESTSIRQ